MGATPEQLMKSSGITMYTVALAGTQLASDNQNVVWAEKEINEQKTVTNYIVDVLQSAGGAVFASNPYTFQAGAIVHIKTDIQAKFDSVINASNCIELLHPTPAVCGFPKDLAKAFILNNEGYNREYYAGYLGEWNQEGNFDLYVNLRCMKMEINSQNVTVSLFVGCGINSGSQPEKEFIETVNKSQTLKSILH
jgi:isochorismate synthase